MFRRDIISMFTEMLYKGDMKLQLRILQYPKDIYKIMCSV